LVAHLNSLGSPRNFSDKIAVCKLKHSTGSYRKTGDQIAERNFVLLCTFMAVLAI